MGDEQRLTLVKRGHEDWRCPCGQSVSHVDRHQKECGAARVLLGGKSLLSFTENRAFVLWLVQNAPRYQSWQGLAGALLLRFDLYASFLTGPDSSPPSGVLVCVGVGANWGCPCQWTSGRWNPGAVPSYSDDAFLKHQLTCREAQVYIKRCPPKLAEADERTIVPESDFVRFLLRQGRRKTQAQDLAACIMQAYLIEEREPQAETRGF